MRELCDDCACALRRGHRARSASADRTRPRAVPRATLVEDIVNTYRVTYERDESGWWVASVHGLRGCHTQGRTVDEARRRVRAAMGLFIDDSATAALVESVRLPADARRAIDAYEWLRTKADKEDQRAAAAARRAIRVLRGGRLKMSVRDAARFLGLSHQRIHQLSTARLSPGRPRVAISLKHREAAPPPSEPPRGSLPRQRRRSSPPAATS